METRGEEIYNEIQRQGISRGRIRFFLAELSEEEKRAYKNYMNRRNQQNYRGTNLEQSNTNAREGMRKLRAERRGETYVPGQGQGRGRGRPKKTSAETEYAMNDDEFNAQVEANLKEAGAIVITEAWKAKKARGVLARKKQLANVAQELQMVQEDTAKGILGNAMKNRKARMEMNNLKLAKQQQTQDKITKGITRFQAVVRGADFRSYTLPNIMENQYINRALERIEKKVATRKISSAVAGMKARKQVKQRRAEVGMANAGDYLQMKARTTPSYSDVISNVPLAKIQGAVRAKPVREFYSRFSSAVKRNKK